VVRHESPAGAAARLRAATATLRALLEAIDDDVWNGPSGLPDLTLGEGVLTLWYDTYVHADDIRDAIGRDSERGGPEITGDAMQFALVATGRADAATIGLDADVSIY
jgi:hypothetical protein